MKDEAQAAGTLRDAGYGVVYRIEEVENRHGGYATVAVWIGKADKPRYHYRVADGADAMQYVARAVNEAAAKAAYKVERAARDKAAKAEMAAEIKVGMVLANSWGYEQTNVDFYEVVGKRGQAVTLRKVESELIEQNGWASGRVKPRPGRYAGEPFRKRIGAYGVSMSHGAASPADTEKGHYCSWYH